MEESATLNGWERTRPNESSRLAGESACPTRAADILCNLKVGYVIRVSDFDRRTDTRLAVYGSLAPGRVNHHQLADLKGRWQRGTVQGKLTDAGWGSALGFPGLILDPAGPTVEVYLFESLDLREHWARLDEFEGTGYRRVVTPVRLADGEVDANIYVVEGDG